MPLSSPSHIPTPHPGLCLFGLSLERHTVCHRSSRIDGYTQTPTVQPTRDILPSRSNRFNTAAIGTALSMPIITRWRGATSPVKHSIQARACTGKSILSTHNFAGYLFRGRSLITRLIGFVDAKGHHSHCCPGPQYCASRKHRQNRGHDLQRQSGRKTIIDCLQQVSRNGDRSHSNIHFAKRSSYQRQVRHRGNAVPLVLLFLSLSFSDLVFSAGVNQQSSLTTQSGNASSTQSTASEIELAKRWDVTVTEWARYKTLMKGPRGMWTPNLDPILVLGNHARDAAERRHLALRAATMEHKRAAGEQAWQNAYDLAFAQLYGTDIYGTTAPSSWQRVQWRGPYDGSTYGLEETLFYGLRHTVPVDVIVIGAPTDDALRRWAQDHSIPTQQVAEKKITLNHGKRHSLRGGQNASVPVIIGLRNNKPTLLNLDSLQ